MKQLTVYQRITEIIYLSKKGAFTFKEIQQKIRKLFEGQGIDQKYSIRTFQRDLNEIRELHGIDIQFSKSRGLYEVNQDYSTPIRTKILESFDMIHTFQLQKGLDSFVFFDERKASGFDHLYTLIYAVKNNFKVRFEHDRGWKNQGKVRNIKPMALKEFKNTWYLIGLNENDEMRNYGLDRISNLQVLSYKFDIQSEINLADYYKNTFGILNDANEPVEKITLSFTPEKGNYIKSKPIHSSQTILINDENEFKITLQLKINPDLIAEILSFGKEVRIKKPEHFRLKMLGIVQEMLQNLEK
jgi:predicted DNA-binding transcriptional regulator YafY